MTDPRAPKECGRCKSKQIRKVVSPRWGTYYRCGRCGYEVKSAWLRQ